MSEIILGEPLASQIREGEPLASQIREAAETQGIAVEHLIEAAFRQYRFQAQRAKLDLEAQWWREAAAEKRAGYAGEYIAIHNRQVVDHDPDEETLRQRIRTQYGKTAVLITPSDGPREWRSLSTWLTRT